MLKKDEVMNIVAVGGGVIIDSRDYSEEELVDIAKSNEGGHPIVIANAWLLSSAALISIGAAGNGNIIFNLCGK